MLIKNAISKPDPLGATASILCLIHCLVPPFIFVAQANSAVHHVEVPLWWGILDFFLLAISLFAVYWTTKTTAKTWMKYAFWASWFILSFVILNEKMALISLAEEAIYFPSLALVFLHLYNQKYHHQCKTA